MRTQLNLSLSVQTAFSTHSNANGRHSGETDKPLRERHLTHLWWIRCGCWSSRINALRSMHVNFKCLPAIVGNLVTANTTTFPGHFAGAVNRVSSGKWSDGGSDAKAGRRMPLQLHLTLLPPTLQLPCLL